MLIDDIKRNKELSNLFDDNYFKIIIFSNVIINQIKDPLELALKEKGVNAQVDFADYDNFVQESQKRANYSVAIFFWEACNLSPGIHYKCNDWTNTDINTLMNKVKSEVSISLSNLKEIPLVIFNSFNSLFFNSNPTLNSNFDNICNELNEYVTSLNIRNCQIVNKAKLISKIGVNGAFNQRMWYDASMLYTYDYLREYAFQVAPSMLALNGKQKKALVLDCDNTLWKGIIGEDGIEGIGYNSDKKDGGYFEEVHHYIKFLQNEGVILALNSKNNFDDVKNFFTMGKRSIFNWDDFIVKKVNWDTKVTNLRNIAKELNIGLDSLVHIDDSDFEINHINAELPEVMTIQVPKKLKDYPNIVKEIIPLFLNRFKTNEDSTRSQLYNIEKQRKEEFEKNENIEDFLQSLELKLTIKLNDNANIVRIAQMTQKTNQFNLTTQRYSESEIENLIKQRQHNIFSFGLNDKFGDYGTTGLCIVRYKDSKKVFIETFLMSCRIIGRNAEYAFFDFLSNYLKMEKIESIESKYIRTFKNEQVSSFYENLGFKLEFSSVDLKNYQISLKDYIPKNINYIKVNYEAAD